MSERELQSWIEFHRLFPFDDLHRFHRPAALVATSLGGGQIQAKLDWLQPPPADDLSDADMNTLKAFGFTRKGP